MKNNELREEITSILEEFAGKVEYYDVPKDLVAYSYKEDDIERARRKIVELVDSLKAELVGKLEGLKASDMELEMSVRSLDEMEITNRVVDEAIELIKKI